MVDSFVGEIPSVAGKRKDLSEISLIRIFHFRLKNREFDRRFVCIGWDLRFSVVISLEWLGFWIDGMRKRLGTRFPAARIKKIMQTDEDVGKMAMAVPALVSKALELFLHDLCRQTHEVTLQRGAKTINSVHLTSGRGRGRGAGRGRGRGNRIGENGMDLEHEYGEGSPELRSPRANLEDGAAILESSNNTLVSREAEPVALNDFDLNVNWEQNEGVESMSTAVLPSTVAKSASDIAQHEFQGWPLSDIEGMTVDSNHFASFSYRIGEGEEDVIQTIMMRKDDQIARVDSLAVHFGICSLQPNVVRSAAERT
ncbi:Dr1-associated corepressor-like protein [Drosera capensis]